MARNKELTPYQRACKIADAIANTNPVAAQAYIDGFRTRAAAETAANKDPWSE